tara:strand:- start:228 stop:338 length:111 start_codon:yes stop_codon:yes gene_type:complete
MTFFQAWASITLGEGINSLFGVAIIIILLFARAKCK